MSASRSRCFNTASAGLAHSAPPKKPTRPKPVSIRLSEAERAWLEREAGELSLSAFIRQRVFGAPRGLKDRAISDPEALGKALHLLAQAEIGKSLRLIAEAVAHGTLSLDAAVQEELVAACAAVQDTRRLLVVALGVRGARR